VHGNPASPCPPLLRTGIFLGAAVVFFTQVGFDAIANAAEEVKDARDLPWAIVGTVCVSTLLYVLLALALALMVFDGVACPNWVFFLTGSSDSVQQTVSFLSAFVSGHCMKWMQYIISVAALLGVVTALTVGLFSLSRIVMAAARDWLLPPFLARVSPRTQTPLVAQMSFGVIIGAAC
jgi:APA family basic amino acid/polyamine antiporter